MHHQKLQPKKVKSAAPAKIPLGPRVTRELSPAEQDRWAEARLQAAFTADLEKPITRAGLASLLDFLTGAKAAPADILSHLRQEIAPGDEAVSGLLVEKGDPREILDRLAVLLKMEGSGVASPTSPEAKDDEALWLGANRVQVGDLVVVLEYQLGKLLEALCKGRTESVAAGGRKTERPIPTLPATRGSV